jgi:hypothetical protein
MSIVRDFESAFNRHDVNGPLACFRPMGGDVDTFFSVLTGDAGCVRAGRCIARYREYFDEAVRCSSSASRRSRSARS